MKRFGGLMLVIFALAGFVPLAMAQDSAGPQILTSDLRLDTVADTDTRTVTFVIVSDVDITKITIDGKDVQFTPGDTVSITRDFHFTKANTLITISATDKNGVTRDKSYSVAFKGAPAETKLTYAVVVKAALEVDGNPTNDLSSPIHIQGVDINGVVKDSQQSDTRTTLQATGAVTYGKWTGFAGAYNQTYGKADNKDLNVQVLYLGGTGRFNLSGTRNFLLTYAFTDVNVGSNDYAQMHTITPAYEATSSDNKGAYTHTFALDVTVKDFASSSQTDGSQGDVRWNYRSVNADKLNQFDSVIALGDSTEGIKAEDYNYFGANFDWINRWEKGFRLDAGFGFDYRDFPNDKQPLTDKLFGNHRVDTLWRASLGAGWQFNPKWSAMFNYRYLTDISNKAPYVRPIYGVTVDGVF